MIVAHVTFQHLLDYIEYRLDKTEQTEMEAHLTACYDCQDKLKMVRHLIKGMLGSNRGPSPPSLHRRIITAVRHSQNWLAQRIRHRMLQRDDQSDVTSRASTSTHKQYFLGTFDTFDVHIQIYLDVTTDTLLLQGQILPNASDVGDLEGIPIQLFAPGGEKWFSNTDRLGRFTCTGLAPGNYVLLGALDEFDFLIAPLIVQ